MTTFAGLFCSRHIGEKTTGKYTIFFQLSLQCAETVRCCTLSYLCTKPCGPKSGQGGAQCKSWIIIDHSKITTDLTLKKSTEKGHESCVSLIEPVSHLQLLFLMQRAVIIMTDSGGIQEEATAMAKPVVVLRENSERREGIDQGVALLVGSSNASHIARTSLAIIHNKGSLFDSMSRRKFPYGNGTASMHICNALYDFFFFSQRKKLVRENMPSKSSSKNRSIGRNFNLKLQGSLYGSIISGTDNRYLCPLCGAQSCALRPILVGRHSDKIYAAATL